MDHHTWLHKLLTYGVGIALVCACFAVSAMSDEVIPAIGTLILIFLLYYALLSRRTLETLIFGGVHGACADLWQRRIRVFCRWHCL